MKKKSHEFVWLSVLTETYEAAINFDCIRGIIVSQGGETPCRWAWGIFSLIRYCIYQDTDPSWNILEVLKNRQTNKQQKTPLVKVVYKWMSGFKYDILKDLMEFSLLRVSVRRSRVYSLMLQILTEPLEYVKYPARYWR